MNFTRPSFWESSTSWQIHQDAMLDHMLFLHMKRDRTCDQILGLIESFPDMEDALSQVILDLYQTEDQYQGERRRFAENAAREEANDRQPVPVRHPDGDEPTG